jgi:outer membrane protein OmpA-like peptidoglycan-associated protein
MKIQITGFLLLILVIMSVATAPAQKLGGGVGIGMIYGETSLVDKVPSMQGRAFLRYPLQDILQAEFGMGVGSMTGDRYHTELVPVDLRLVCMPVTSAGFTPFVYAGAGLLNYKVKDVPPIAPTDATTEGWTGYIPLGLGLQIALNDRFSFETSAGYNRSFTDNLKAVELDRKDAFWSFLFGVSTGIGEGENADSDGDGLTNKEEAQLGTDPHNKDTDGDGLLDGTEVNKYRSNPLKVDSDGDGLSDYDEVMKYGTDPNKADTDGDGLNDGDELLKYKTDPLKADTDGDGLNDGDEILKYKTDPLKTDTDGDGLSDGDEVLKYKTDPLKVDTDGGTVSDGQEVKNGTNPLDPSDDIPKPKETLKSEVGKAIVLEGIVFKTGSAEITPESESILVKAYNTLAENKEIQVEIDGFTDNVGKRAANLTLSLKRADAVKADLVKRGIVESRITTKGFGPDRPIASNATKEGKQKNRRIEFLRTK